MKWIDEIQEGGPRPGGLSVLTKREWLVRELRSRRDSLPGISGLAELWREGRRLLPNATPLAEKQLRLFATELAAGLDRLRLTISIDEALLHKPHLKEIQQLLAHHMVAPYTVISQVLGMAVELERVLEGGPPTDAMIDQAAVQAAQDDPAARQDAMDTLHNLFRASLDHEEPRRQDWSERRSSVMLTEEWHEPYEMQSWAELPSEQTSAVLIWVASNWHGCASDFRPDDIIEEEGPQKLGFYPDNQLKNLKTASNFRSLEKRLDNVLGRVLDALSARDSEVPAFWKLSKDGSGHQVFIDIHAVLPDMAEWWAARCAYVVLQAPNWSDFVHFDDKTSLINRGLPFLERFRFWAASNRWGKPETYGHTHGSQFIDLEKPGLSVQRGLCIASNNKVAALVAAAGDAIRRGDAFKHVTRKGAFTILVPMEQLDTQLFSGAKHHYVAIRPVDTAHRFKYLPWWKEFRSTKELQAERRPGSCRGCGKAGCVDDQGYCNVCSQ